MGETGDPQITGSAQPTGPANVVDVTAAASRVTVDVSLSPQGRTKHDLRRRIRAERRGRTDDERRADAESLAVTVLDVPEVARAGCVALYASMPVEPGTAPLRAELRRRGVRVLLPVVLPDGVLDWAQDTGDLVAPVGFGGDEPDGPRLGREAIRDADVVLVPATAVDTLGHRLGQGAGYYDRALPLLDPAVPVIAVVHDGEVLDAAVEPLPAEPHDVPVDGVVTPRTFLRIEVEPAP